MLVRLLRSLLTRARRPAPAQSKAQEVVVPRSVAPRAGNDSRTPAYSQLQLLSRLASFVGGQELVVTGKEAQGDDSASRLPRAEQPVMEVVAHASRLVSETLDAATDQRVRRYAAAFAAAAAPGPGVNIFTFHVDMPASAEINYVDIKLKPQEFDYLDILRRFVQRIREHCPGATVYVVTTPGARYAELAAADVRVIELPLDASQPMYERANALLAYVRSGAFVRDTAFLDSDALVNRPLQEVFELGFDVGLTYRDTPYLMPVNEGVMFLGARRPEAVRRFLERRLATYDALADDAFVTGYYGNVKRWRGGQLSLNAAAYHLIPHSPYRVYEQGGCRVRMLPGDTFNFASGEGEAASSVEHLDDRYVVHFKGNRKHAFRVARQAIGAS
jgi:hypothetical protein